MSTTTPQRRANRRQEVRRQVILAAAAAEFADVGYDAATLERIGERVGLSKAGLYYYVENKEQLFAALLADTIAQIEAASRVPAGTAPIRRLRTFVTAHLRVAVTTPEGKVLTENLDALMTRSPSTKLDELRRAHEQFLTDILVAGIDAGDFREVAVRPTVKLIFGALNTVPRWYDPAGPLVLGELVDDAVELLLTGLTPRRTRQ